jgi:hypothetical protein
MRSLRRRRAYRCLIVEDVDEIEQIILEELGPIEDAPFMRRKLHVLT